MRYSTKILAKQKKWVIWLLPLLYCFIPHYGMAQVWFEDWEGDWTVHWHPSAGTWSAGSPSSGPGSAYFSPNCAATALAGNYAEPVDSRMIRHTSFVVPPAYENPRLRFWHWYSFSSGDYGEVQISLDGQNWQTISATYTNTSSGIWTYPFIDLSAFAGSSVQIAFYFHSHQSGSFGNVSAGWYIDDVAVMTGSVVFNILERFEGGIGDWASERGTWEVGVPYSGPGSAFAGQNCAATRLNGNYAEPVDSRLISPPVVIPHISQNPRLRFWHWYSFSSGDFGEVQISLDGQNWQTISATYTNTSSGVWTYPFIDLSAFAGSTIQIAFYFHSHQSGSFGNVSTGWYVDDIEIITGPVVFNNPNSFEGGIGDWASERGTWEVGVPSSGPGSAFAGQNCAATRLNGNYAEPVDSRLTSPYFFVTGQSPALRFWHWYSFSSGDYGEVQIRVDDGVWQPVSSQFVNTSSSVWTNFYIPLSAYTNSNVQIAFFFHSHQSGSFGNVSAGWYLDNIEIDGLSLPLVVSAGADINICEGNSVTLGGIASGGSGSYTYSWNPAVGLSSTTVSNPVASPLSTTTYTLAVTDGAGSTAMDDVRVIVNPVPETPHIIQINGNTLQSSVSGDNYQWFFNSTPLPYHSQSILISESGEYTVIVTANGCDSEVSTPLVVEVVGIEDASNTEFLKVFPNPSTGIFYLEAAWEQPTMLNLALISLTGKVLQEWQMALASPSPLPVDLSAYPSGAYLLQIAWNTNRAYKKILLTKNR